MERFIGQGRKEGRKTEGVFACFVMGIALHWMDPFFCCLGMVLCSAWYPFFWRGFFFCCLLGELNGGYLFYWHRRLGQKGCFCVDRYH